jgi:hypothetical protein
LPRGNAFLDFGVFLQIGRGKSPLKFGVDSFQAVALLDFQNGNGRFFSICHELAPNSWNGSLDNIILTRIGQK